MQAINDVRDEKEKATPFAALFSVPVEVVENPKSTQIEGGDDDKPTTTSIAPGQD